MRLGVLSDLHWPGAAPISASWHNAFDFDGLPGRLEGARALFDAAGTDAVVVAGDLGHTGEERALRDVVERLGRALEVPVLAVAGNHDCLQRDDQLERCAAGRVRALDAAGVDVAGIRIAGVAIERVAGSGGFRTAAASTLRPDPAAVVVSHFPVLSRARPVADRGWAYPGDLLDRRDLAGGMAAARRPVIVLSGHIHVRDGHARGPILQLSAGALVEPPYEAAIVDVERSGGAVRVRRRVERLGPSAGARDPVLAPADARWTYDHGRWRRERGEPGS